MKIDIFQQGSWVIYIAQDIDEQWQPLVIRSRNN